MLRALVRAAAATLVVLGVAECVLRAAYFVRNAAVDYVPLPYVIGQIYGPVPPWVDGLRLLEEDGELLWKGRPNVRRKYVDIFSPVDREEDRTALLRHFLPTLPAALKANPVWEVALDSEGFREMELPRTKPPSVLRIVCLGDSWTFGANVAADDSYPDRLQALLRRDLADDDVEVLNLGVLGYSSYQGLRLLRRRVLDLDPDVLVIGFGMNDSSVAGYHDKERVGSGPPSARASSWLERALGDVELYKLERYAVARWQFQAPSLGDYLDAATKARPESSYLVPGASGMRRWAELDGRTRVSPSDYAANLAAMVDVAKGRGIDVVFLYTDLVPESPYRTVLQEVATRMGVPLVDCSALIAAARHRIEDGVETELGLRPPASEPARPGDPATVVLRVRTAPVAKAVYLAAPALGALLPNTVAMYDDGTHGDQRAGDGVWSLAATVQPETPVFYVYTKSGTPGAWNGLDVPEIRAFTAPANAGQTVYRPIDTFGRVYMQADSWHPDAAGYDLIAHAVLARVMELGRVASRRAARASAAGELPVAPGGAS
jgi:lysophospholipase L1-like esterase